MKKNQTIHSRKRLWPKLFLVMRLSIILFLAFTFTVKAESFSQTTRLNLNLTKSTKLVDVFAAIEKQSDFYFYYSMNLDEINVQNAKYRNKSVDEVLNSLLRNTGLTYKVVDHYIVIKKAGGQKPPTIPQPAQQQRVIKGKVIDRNSQPLPGVTIMVKGTDNGTTTDPDGNYSLSNVPQNATLVFSFIGLKQEEIKVSGKGNTINTTMFEESIGLNEIVAVGFGSQKKVSVIGAVTTVEPRKLITSNASLSSSLAGQLAGVLAVQRSGEPGRDQSDFWIRGVSTFNSNSQKALVLVDGIERDINNVDPLDIESFSILKDATATAVYGVRGANGVILINTKRGKTGIPKIQVQLESGITAPTQLPKYIDGAQYMEIYNEACRNSGVTERYTQDRIDKTRSKADPDLYPSINWLNEVFQDFSTNEKANLNVSGGTDRITYYVSGAYLHENGILKTKEMEDDKSNLKFDRFNFRSNIDLNLSKSTLFRLNLGGYYKEKNQPGYSVSDIFYATLAATPIGYPKQYSDGSYAHMPGSQMNPWMASTHSGYSLETENQIESTISLEQKLDFIAKGLSIKGLFSFDAYNDQLTVLRKHPTTYYAMGRDEDGQLILKPEEGEDYVNLASESNISSRSNYIETQANYLKTFADKHTISALILYNQRSSKYTPAYSEVGSLPYRTNGLAGRLTYNFDNRYFIEGNFGYNGSENFAPGKKYGFFPSAAVGWLISSEKF
ncbi:MAG: SusC/RagA family TonB-linked outer membrane protein, partial [Bacteroidota bacterium]|nr:SusC/RagA family TonB-linked outer membrane protein [Bacteroidota bacterium]